MIYEMHNYRQAELQAHAHQIEFRRQWYDLQALHRLEDAVARVRGRFSEMTEHGARA
jgi:hypothetical protein